jgi:uncharacterized protein (DUF924 family)
MSTVTPTDIISFWRDAGPDKWWEKNEDFDREIRSKFLATHEAAARGELASFEGSAEGALALVLLFDQFPRNMFRDSARAFATDAQARAAASRAIARGFDQETEEAFRKFFYMPFMHSEFLADQDRCVQLFSALDDPEQGEHATIHRDIIAKFGRFPHRNRTLGRETTAAEQDFLDGGGFAG